jgi:hypothetical protein
MRVGGKQTLFPIAQDASQNVMEIDDSCRHCECLHRPDRTAHINQRNIQNPSLRFHVRWDATTQVEIAVIAIAGR